MNATLRIGTRESELAVWQATLVKELLAEHNYDSTLVYIKSEGDIDLKTPLYEMGVQGIFTRSLDIALLNNKIDIAVHSMKDVPTALPPGIQQGAVLKRGNSKDLFVFREPAQNGNDVFHQLSHANDEYIKNISSSLSAPDATIKDEKTFSIATSSIRRIAQWLYRYPNSTISNLRGNVNTRLKKLAASEWQGAIFAAAGLERISLRPQNAVELDWMLPAPAQGAIMVVCRSGDSLSYGAVSHLNDEQTAICTKLERDFLKELLGGCSTPISALAECHNKDIYFQGNILSTNGKEKAVIIKHISFDQSEGMGKLIAIELLKNGGKEISDNIQHAK